jgi:hypothetical protein
MNANTLRFGALLLAALAMGMHLAHALELLPKRNWDGAQYHAVQSTLYVWFGRIGPVLELGALVLVLALALRLRARAVGAGAIWLSCAMLVAALGTWAVVVLPAHAQIQSWSAASLPADWAAWRDRWQFGQAGILLLHLVGFCALLRGVLSRTASD